MAVQSRQIVEPLLQPALVIETLGLAGRPGRWSGGRWLIPFRAANCTASERAVHSVFRFSLPIEAVVLTIIRAAYGV